MARYNRVSDGSTIKPIIMHKAFVPLIAAWFAAFLGLSMLVLADADISRLTMVADQTALDYRFRTIAALSASILGTAIGFGFAQLVQRVLRRSGQHSPSEPANPARPMDLAEALGSESLDAPITEPDVVECSPTPEPQNPQCEDPQTASHSNSEDEALSNKPAEEDGPDWSFLEIGDDFESAWVDPPSATESDDYIDGTSKQKSEADAVDNDVLDAVAIATPPQNEGAAPSTEVELAEHSAAEPRPAMDGSRAISDAA